MVSIPVSYTHLDVYKRQGWYNTAEFHRLAAEKGAYAKTVNGDAFSKEIKDKAIELIKKDLGKVDLVVYSLAAPRRTDSEGKIWSSCLKTTGAVSYTHLEENRTYRNS